MVFLLQVLEDFPSVDMPFEWLVQLTPPLKTRAFSISSSPHVHPNQVHLTVSIVSWTTPFKRKRIGLCSNWLASLHLHQSMESAIPFHSFLDSIIPNTTLLFLLIFFNRSLHTSMVSQRLTPRPTPLTPPHPYWARNRLCTFSRVRGGAGLKRK